MRQKELNLANLAHALDMKIEDLAKPIKRIVDFDYDQILPELADGDAPTFRRNKILEISKIAKIPDYPEKANLELNEVLFNFVLEQGKNSKHLISVPNIARKNNLDVNHVRRIIREWNKSKRYLLNDYLVTNIFRSTRDNFVDEKRENAFVQLLLIQFCLENKKQSLEVKTSDVAFSTMSSFIWTTLLEQVQDPNSTKGRVIAFAKTAEGINTPIVRWYNGNISFAANLQHSPRSSGNLDFRRLKLNKRVAGFIFPLSDIMDFKRNKRKAQLFNIFLRSLAHQAVEIRVSMKDALQPQSTTNTGRVYVKVNPIRLNVEGLDFNPNDTPGIKAEKEKAYGSNGATNKEFVEFLNNYADDNTKTIVSYKQDSNKPVYIHSSSYKVSVYLKDRNAYELLKKRASENKQNLGDYIRGLSDLNSTETQLSVYKKDHEAYELKEKSNLEKRVGKHVLFKNNLNLESNLDQKAKVKAYLTNFKIPEPVRKIILDDPLTVFKISKKIK